MRKKQKHRSKVNFGKDFEVILWPVRGVFGPGGRSGSIFLEVEILCKKKSRDTVFNARCQRGGNPALTVEASRAKGLSLGGRGEEYTDVLGLPIQGFIG